MAEPSIPKLAAFEFRGTEDIAEYSKALRDLCRAIATEVDYAAAELQAILQHAGEATLQDKFQARMKARKVTRRLRRARNLLQGASVEAVKFWAVYRREYDPFIDPPKNGGNAWQWKSLCPRRR